MAAGPERGRPRRGAETIAVRAVRARRRTPSRNRASTSARKHQSQRRTEGPRKVAGGQSAKRILNDTACRTIKNDIISCTLQPGESWPEAERESWCAVELLRITPRSRLAVRIRSVLHPLHPAARFVGACAPWRSGSCSTTSTRRLGSPMSLPAPPCCGTLGRTGCCSGTG